MSYHFGLLLKVNHCLPVCKLTHYLPLAYNWIYDDYIKNFLLRRVSISSFHVVSENLVRKKWFCMTIFVPRNTRIVSSLCAKGEYLLGTRIRLGNHCVFLRSSGTTNRIFKWYQCPICPQHIWRINRIIFSILCIEWLLPIYEYWTIRCCSITTRSNIWLQLYSL